VREKEPGRGGWLLVTALLATTATALAFVDAAGPQAGAAIETQPGFYAVFGLCAAITLAMLARALRLGIGRPVKDPGSEERR
jgi:hypothetical protein